MKKYIDIYVDGQAADVDVSGLSLSIQYSIEESEPGKIRGAHSKRAITLPPTSVNKEIAENIQEPASITSSAGKLQSARIEVNGMPILSGKAQLQGVGLDRRGRGLRASGYKYAFFGSNADWFQDLGDLRIRDLGWTDRTLTTSAVEAMYIPDDETCFTVIKWAEWAQSSAIRHVDHTPALFVSAILDKAFTSIGYSFSSLYNSDPWNRLIVPVPLNLDGEYSESSVNVRAAHSATQTINHTGASQLTVVAIDDDATLPNKDPGSNYNEGGHTYPYSYKVPVKGFYRFKSEIVISNFASDQDGQSVAEITFYLNNATALNGAILTLDTSYSFESSGTFEVDDEIQIVAATIHGLSGSFAFDISATLTVDFEKENWFLGDPISFQNIIPITWKVRDLITDLARIHNLKFETDVQAGTVEAWPSDYYYATYRADGSGAATTSAQDGFFLRSSAVDMSTKWDVSKGGELNIITDRQRDYVLDWATDDVTTEAIESAKGISLYSARWRFPAGRFPEGENRIRTGFFAKTIHIPANDIYSTSSTDFIPQIPLIYPENYLNTSAGETDYNFAPRLLYYAGRRGGDDGYINLYYTDTSATSAYDFPASFMVNYNDSSGVDVSLSFCDETTNAGSTVIGLLTRFHAQSIKRIEVGKQFEYALFWDEIDLAQLSFRYRIEVDNDKYILQQIDGYNPLSNDSTKTVMLLDAVPTEDDISSKVTGPVGEGENSITGGSGGAGAFIGGALLSGSESGFYEEFFTAPVAQTINITVNNGTLPSNKAQIWVYANGMYIDSSEYSVTNIDGSDDQITFTYTPVSVVNITVRFRYP